jgi:hypothetical protein
MFISESAPEAPYWGQYGVSSYRALRVVEACCTCRGTTVLPLCWADPPGSKPTLALPRSAGSVAGLPKATATSPRQPAGLSCASGGCRGFGAGRAHGPCWQGLRTAGTPGFKRPVPSSVEAWMAVLGGCDPGLGGLPFRTQTTRCPRGRGRCRSSKGASLRAPRLKALRFWQACWGLGGVGV